MPKIVTDFEKQSRKRKNFRAARALSDISIIRAALSDISVTTILKTLFARKNRREAANFLKKGKIHVFSKVKNKHCEI